jgi:RimJ/RimL family protein N-acetyltransferase
MEAVSTWQFPDEEEQGQKEGHSFTMDSVPNWPGCDYPLACRVLKAGDQRILFPVMKRSAKKLKGFIGWAKYAPSWDYQTVTKFVNDHLEDELPRFHLVFSIGKQVVGFGSLAPVSSSQRDVQVALWVALGWEKRGIGSWITTVLEWYAFNVFGFDHVYYQHDSANRSSGKLPQKLGYVFSHTFDQELQAMGESGLWYAWKKSRPRGLPPGVIDTGKWGGWTSITFPWTSLV